MFGPLSQSHAGCGLPRPVNHETRGANNSPNSRANAIARFLGTTCRSASNDTPPNHALTPGVLRSPAEHMMYRCQTSEIRDAWSRTM